MKRSDMIICIATEIKSEFDDDPCFISEEVANDIAKNVLNRIECEGMLPPPDFTTVYYSSDEAGGYNPNSWEEEDDSDE